MKTPRYPGWLVTLGLLFHVFQLPAQTCGTQLRPENVRAMRSLDEQWQQIADHDYSHRAGASLSMVPAQLHIIRTTAGTGGIPADSLLKAFDRVNAAYVPANIQLYQAAPIHYIDDDTYFDFNTADEFAMRAAHEVAGVVNIYVANSVGNGAVNYCGYAYFPGGPDLIMLDASCALNGSTFEHEVGHYFALYHTHETFNGAELVDGSNCLSAGDQICDTPADPNLSGSMTPLGCAYTGTAIDGNSMTYVPQVDNVMSYASKECRTMFTPQQYARMDFYNQNFRAYLNAAPPLRSRLVAVNNQACASGATVDFSDASVGGATNWLWDFGDGTTSTLQNPSHTYAAAGQYDVSLTVSDGVNNDTYTGTREVLLGPVPLPFTLDFEGGLGAFRIDSMFKNRAYVDASAGNGGGSGLLLEGQTQFSSPFFYTPTAATAFDPAWNPFFRSALKVCVDATNYQALSLTFDLRQVYGYNDNYTNFRVTVDGVDISGVYQPNGASTAWQNILIDLTPYTGTTFELAFEGSHKYGGSAPFLQSATMIDNIALSGVLPVTWQGFEAVVDGMAARLRWEVSDELHCDRYEVLRSADGETWQTVGTIAGQNPDHGESQYDWRDEAAGYLGKELLYYQLRQVDIDGRFVLSDIQQLRFRVQPRLVIAPNPVTNGEVLLDFPDGQAQGRVFLYDVHGRMILQAEIDRPQMKWDLRAIPAGVYQLCWQADGRLIVQKILIQ